MKPTLITTTLLSIILTGFMIISDVSEWVKPLAFLGNFHPLILHIPIGTLLGVLFIEITNTITKKDESNASITLLWLSVFGAYGAVIAGVFLASTGGYNVELLNYHKWLGYATAIIITLLLIFRKNLYPQKQTYKWIYKTLLFISILVISIAGHFGGTLTHGKGYLTQGMPDGLKNLLGIELSESEKMIADIGKNNVDTIPETTQNFLNKVRPILDQNCFECHNESKQKGDIRLDNLNWVMNKPDVLEKWEEVLFEVSEKNMPPKEKEPLTPHDREEIINWIHTSLKENNPIKEVLAAKEEEKSIQQPLLALANTKKMSKEELYYFTEIKPVFDKYCYQCHGPKKQKGNTRLDILNWDLIHGNDAEKWNSALNEINTGEMPPENKPQPTNTEREKVVEWLTSSLDKASKAKQEGNKSIMRRLTKKQYTNSLQELLNLPMDFGKSLPNDGKSKMGFSNNGAVLQVSALHMDYYQKIARHALDIAIVDGPKPKSTKYKVTFGKGIGKGKPGKEFGGFQAVTVKKDNFTINVSNPIGVGVLEVQNKIGIDMRGSSTDRFEINKEGIMLDGILPHKEKAPFTWQGPSPNLEMLIQNHLPPKGNFVFRVEASKGHFNKAKKLVLNAYKKSAAPFKGAVHITATNFNQKKLKNLKIVENRWILAKDITQSVSGNFTFNIPKTGYYQIDMVHLYSAKKNRPFVRLTINQKKIKHNFNISKEFKDKDSIITPLKMFFLEKGVNKGVIIQKKFLVGLSRLILTPIPEDSPSIIALDKENESNKLKFQNLKPSIKVFAGIRTDDGMDYKTYDVSKVVNANFGDSQTLEFYGNFENLPIPTVDLNDKSPLSNIMIMGLWNNFIVDKKNETGIPLFVKSIEVESPYYPVWPPKSHSNILFDSPNNNTPEIYTREVIQKFMTRAFRRKVSDHEINRYMNFWLTIKDDYVNYQDSVKEVLVAILCSPNFLYIFQDKEEHKKQSDDYYLASKLSYFLWNAPPDRKLKNLAARGTLKGNISDEIKRMINTPKVLGMIRSFAYEWLRIDRHLGISTHITTYPDYTRFVKDDMTEETYQFLHHTLKNDLSIMNFIDSDFAMLNQNLAQFYGIKGVFGAEFRPVTLDRKQNRGGLLSQGAFLNGHSDGTQGHAIKRAVWLKEKILGDPAPPPPPNVPELDPDTPGFDKMTLKEKLELHRNKPSCNSCHQKIDPYGFVFENYDAVGRIQTTNMGKPVETKTTLPDGTEVNGIQGIKNYILTQKKEAFTKSLVEHLYAYALGRNVTFADDAEINAIVQKVKKKNYNFQSVIEGIVTSPSFTDY